MLDILSKDIIRTEEELRAELGYPSELVNKKVIKQLDSHCVEFISKSPLIFISTSSQGGACDVSPRGDAAGFVDAVTDSLLIIPERPGNKRCDSLLNIISNPHIGILFLIPGLKETLRVNGKASISKDEELLAKYQVEGKLPKLAILVEVEECFIHCAKAFMRSKTWEHTSWLTAGELPQASKILAAHINSEAYSTQKISEVLKESYTTRLY